MLFALVIETLALAIRHNTNIQGIRCGNLHKKLALLADDAILALQHNQITFTALLQTLQQFAIVSNLAINQEKSLVIPVGTNVHSRIPLQGMERFPYLKEDTFAY